MKINLFFLGFIFSFSALAQPTEQQLDRCEKEGLHFGNGLGKNTISIDCYSHFLKSLSPEAFKKTSDGKISAYGHRNIVFIQDPQVKSDRQNVIAGIYTELEDVAAVALNEKQKEIAVLEKSGDILFFSSTITGNVAPLRILKNKELSGASDLVINSLKMEVIVLNKKSHEILFFSSQANAKARPEKKKLNLLRSFDNIYGEHMTIDTIHQELFVLSPQKDALWVYDLNSGFDQAVRKISLPSIMKSVSKIEYSSLQDEVVLSGMPEQMKIPRVTAPK
jgi:hypothetical protein